MREPYYDQNDTIVAYYDISGEGNDLMSYGSGYWQLPKKDFSGYCNDFNLVKFENDITIDSNDGCLRNIPSVGSLFSEYCSGVWSIDYYVSRLRLAR